MKQPDRKCKMQHGLEMDAAFCDLAQFSAICRGCEHDQGRERSIWHLRQEKLKQETSK